MTIGGRDVREYTLESLMEQVSMVFQRVYLFADTVENNIKFGCPDATHEQVVAAAKAACCHDFISALPNGYDTVIGEGGSTLSGGEKQRISIARAMLKNAPIVILDEATASVDPENEHLIQQALSALTKGENHPYHRPSAGHHPERGPDPGGGPGPRRPKGYPRRTDPAGGHLPGFRLRADGVQPLDTLSV